MIRSSGTIYVDRPHRASWFCIRCGAWNYCDVEAPADHDCPKRDEPLPWAI